jgi:hypothetical protein
MASEARVGVLSAVRVAVLMIGPSTSDVEVSVDSAIVAGRKTWLTIDVLGAVLTALFEIVTGIAVVAGVAVASMLQEMVTVRVTEATTAATKLVIAFAVGAEAMLVVMVVERVLAVAVMVVSGAGHAVGATEVVATLGAVLTGTPGV